MHIFGRKCFTKGEEITNNAFQLDSAWCEEWSCHTGEKWKVMYNVYLAHQQETEIRIKFNKSFYKNEKEIHGENQKVIICMKNTLPWSICNQITDDETPGIVARNLPQKIVKLKDYIHKSPYLHTILYLFKKTLTITNIYLDLLKDLLLVVTIISAIGGFHVIFGNASTFPSVVSKLKSQKVALNFCFRLL